MEIFLQTIGWWNFAGSFVILGMLNQNFGQKIMVDWTKFFKEPFVLNYWGKLWLFWAAGLNIFFGLINIMSVKFGNTELMRFLIFSDLFAYLIFLALVLWGMKSGRMGSGAYSIALVFIGWMAWGLYSLAT